MAFNYDTLKRITREGVVSDTISAGDLAADSITNAKLANSSVGSSELANNSVVLSGSDVTGSLPVSRGGTGLTSVGGANQALTINSSNNGLTYANVGMYGMQVFTGSGTWNRPSGVRFIKVQISGGGGGGSGHGESGGAGGYSERVLDITGISSVSVSLSGTSNGTYYSGRGNNGGSSSFGPYLSASGGYGANRNNQHSGGLGGVGSGGTLTMYGGGGQSHHNRSSVGGDSFWGGAVAAGHPQGGHFSHRHENHSAPGSGGSGGYFHGHRGSNGRPGFCVVTMYY